MKVLKITRTKNKKHKNIFLLAKGKSSSVDNLISQALIDLQISHEKFKTIINEKRHKKIKKVLE